MSRDVGAMLGEALREGAANFMNFGARVEVHLLDSREWASVTFAGARHRLSVVIDGPGAVGGAADLLDALPDLELAVRGQIIADMALVAEERRDGGDHAVLELEALTIEDC